MSATLEDPFLLSSYSIDVSYGKASDRFSIATTPLVRAQEGLREGEDSADKGKSSATAYHGKTVAVTTVQRSAVHLVDPTDQSPLSSFTVSPSVAFTTPAVSVSYTSPSLEQADEVGVPSTSLAGQQALRTRKTFVGVETEEGTHEVWCWTEQEKKDGTAVEDASKTVHELQAMAISIDVSAINGDLVVAHSNGVISVHDLEFELLARCTIASVSATEHVSRVRAVASVSLEQLPYLKVASTRSARVLPVIVYSSQKPTQPKKGTKKGKAGKKNSEAAAAAAQPANEKGRDTAQSARLVFLLFDAANTKALLELATWKVQGDDIVDVAFSPTQNLVQVLDRRGRWTTSTLSTTNSTLRNADTILQESSAVSPFKLQAAQHKQLVLKTDTSAFHHARVLALHASAQRHHLPTSTFCLLVIPQFTPASASLLLLLIDSRYGLVITEQTIAMPAANASSSSDSPVHTPATPQVDVCQLDGITFALSTPVASTSESIKRVSVYSIPSNIPSSSTLAHLIGKQSLTVKHTQTLADDQQGNEQPDGMEATPTEALLATMRKLLTSNKDDRDAHEAEEVYIDWVKAHPARPSPHFAARLIKLCVQPNLSVPYRIVNDLLKQEALANGDVASPGLTATLLTSSQSNLKKCIHVFKAAARHLPDMPESAVVGVLRALAAKVDELDTQEFVDCARLFIDRPMSPSTLRVALKKQMTLEEVEPLLYLLNCWLSGDLAESCPQNYRVVTFTQCIFDAHLVAILQQPSLRDLIAQMQEHLAGQIALYDSMGALKAPLEALSQAVAQMEVADRKRPGAAIERRHARLVRQAAEKAARTGNPADAVVPELKLTREQRKQIKNAILADPQERWARKQKIIEERMLVGDYTVEEFRL